MNFIFIVYIKNIKVEEMSNEVENTSSTALHYYSVKCCRMPVLIVSTIRKNDCSS